MPLALLCLLAGLGAAPALAEGYSADIELLHPGFSATAIPGVDSPAVEAAGSLRLGLLGQYEEDPLILYDAGYEVGAIVGSRGTAQVGLSYDLTDRASARLVLPGYLNAGSETPQLAADGGGVGDVALAVRFEALDAPWLALGFRGDLIAPTGKKESYIGDTSLRTGGALLAEGRLGRRASVLLDAGAITRSKVETDADFTLGPELVINSGVRVAPVERHVWLYGGVLTRGGLTNLWDAGSGENPVEAIGGVQIRPAASGRLQLDVGAGKGLADGYGTTQQRLFAGVIYSFDRQPSPDPDPEPLGGEPHPWPEIEPPEPGPEIVIDPWAEGDLALPVGDQILIRDPIQFEFNTANILPMSLPTLLAVAAVMNENPRIGHVVIEGHASEEGSFLYNYDLSIRRARAVWEQLVLAGVHPDRLSYKGMGEIIPAQADAGNEAQLAENRRVEFHIVREYGPLDILPTYTPIPHVPWGEEGDTGDTGVTP